MLNKKISTDFSKSLLIGTHKVVLVEYDAQNTVMVSAERVPTER